MKRRNSPLVLWLVMALVLAACRGSTAESETMSVESNRDGVFTIAADDRRQSLPAPQETSLKVGEGVDVDERGRAILRFADLLTVEVLRDGELTLQELAADEGSAVVSVLQNGGALLNDFNPAAEIDRRFTVQTEFATITATGTRFLVVREADRPLEWVVALDAGPDDLTVTASGVSRAVVGGTARSVAAGAEPGQAVPYDQEALDAWIDGLRRDEPTPLDIDEVVGVGLSELVCQDQGSLNSDHPEDTCRINAPHGSVLTVHGAVDASSEGVVRLGLFTGFTGESLFQLSPYKDISPGENGTLVYALSDIGGAHAPVGADGGEFVLKVWSLGGRATYQLQTEVESQQEGGFEGDAGQDAETARIVQLDTVYSGIVAQGDPIDFYLVQVPEGVAVKVEASVEASSDGAAEITAGLIAERIAPGDSETFSYGLDNVSDGEFPIVVRSVAGGAPSFYQFQVISQDR